MVPPVMYSTGTPVSAVNFFAMMLATRSRQLPPHTLTTNLSCATASSAGAKIEMANAVSAMQIRLIYYLYWLDELHPGQAPIACPS